MQTGKLPAARETQAVETIGRNARLQARLIEDILDVSRIITGKLELERLPIALTPLLESVVSGFAPDAQTKGVTLTADVADDLPLIEGDPKRLQQVLGNIVSNAVKFTPAGGRVALRCRTDGAVMEITVEDTGTGIEAAFLPHVFERFRQADSGTTRQHGGLGLGLAIARYLVEQHGGTIAAESAGAGAGTRICVRLPAAPGTVHDVVPIVATTAAHPDAALAGACVLVVDDEEDSRDMVVAIIEGAGGHAVVCEHAAAALRAADDCVPRLVVADIAMPGVDGYTLITRLRDRHPHLPAIAVSAHARLEDRARALERGYDAYHTKPVDVAGLLHDVRRLLARDVSQI